MSHPSGGHGGGDGLATSAVYDAVSRDSLDELLEILDELSVSANRDRQSYSRSFINYTSPQDDGQSAIHLSGKKLNAEILSLLLLHGANPNAQDAKGHTPVLSVLTHLKDICQCEDCRRKAVKCIDILGDHRADMNLRDKSGELLPLYLSAELGLQDCAVALLNHGANATSISAGNGVCPTAKAKDKSLMAVLLERVPEVVLTIFDRAIQTSPGSGQQLPSERSFELTFDMSAIMPPQVTYTYSNSTDQENGNGGNEQENGKDVSPKLSSRIRPRREMGFLSELLDSSRKQDVHVYNAILQHPMVHLFADIKWNRLKFIYFVYMLMQANFLIWYTVFLILVIYVDCHLKKVSDTISMPADGDENSTSTTVHTIETPLGLGPIQIVDPFSCHITLTTKLVACYVLFITLASTMKEMMHLFMDFRNYVSDIVNYIQIIGIGAALATVVIVLNPIAIKVLHVTLYPLASFGIGVCWLQLFLIIGRLPEFAMYLEMLSKITINFAMSLLMYSFILIAFATSYCMLFPTESKLTDFPWALIRIMTSMVGELNFETLFEDTKKLINPWIALAWYVCLLVLVSMVLMNLLVGLAVSDIQGCKRNAEVVVIQRRIGYLVYLEKSFFLGTMFVPCMREFLRKRIAIVVPNDTQIMNWLTRSNSASAGLKVTIRPNDPKCRTRLTSSTKSAIKSWLKRTGTQRSQHTTGQEPGCDSEHGKSAAVHAHIVKPRSHDKEGGVSVAAPAGDNRRMRHMEYKMQTLETRLIELDAKLDRYFERILFIKENNEYEQ